MTAKNSKLARHPSPLVCGGLAVVLVAGCGGGGESAPSSSPGKAGSSTSADPARAGAQPVVAAGTSALQKVGRGTVVSIDAEQAGSVWEVQVVTSGGVEHEARVSQDGTKVVAGPRTKRGDAEDRSENQHQVRGARLDYKMAAKKVVAARSGSVSELNLDDYRGRIAWEADVRRSGTKYEVTIDASSGDVIRNEPDRDD